MPVDPVSASVSALQVINTVWSTFKNINDAEKIIRERFPRQEYFRLFAFNGRSENIYVAVHFRVNECWVTRNWFELQAGETALLLSNETQLKNANVYTYACTSGCETEWTGDDFSETIDGHERDFDLTNLGDSFRNFTIKFT